MPIQARFDNNETVDVGMNDVLSSEAAEDRDQTHLTGFRSATIQAKMPKETEQAFLEKLVLRLK